MLRTAASTRGANCSLLVTTSSQPWGPPRRDSSRKGWAPRAANLGADAVSGRLHSAKFVDWHSWHIGAQRRRESRLLMSTHEDSLTEDVSLVELEKQLNAAVLREDYSAAAALRDDIGRLRVVSTLAVEKVNAEFYQAFQNSDLKAMSEVWGHGEHVQCVHPAAGCIAGRDEVMESWSVVLPSVNFDIKIKDVRVHATDNLGFVTCIEIMEGDDNRGRLVATNVFEKQEGRWVMVHHHASPAPRF